MSRLDHRGAPMRSGPLFANEDERFAIIEAAVRAIEPCVTNETHAWNVWNNIASSEDFRRAIVMIDRERREFYEAQPPQDR